jgi:hypothetical protein
VLAALQPERIEGSIALTKDEQVLKAQLEGIVERGLGEFLKVGAALSEIRAKRLYRREYGTFEIYLQQRFGLHRTHVDALIRSSAVAQNLLDSGIEFPANTTEAVIRPLCGLPGDTELQAATWEFCSVVAPECGVTGPLVGKICRVIRNCLEGVEDDQEEQSERADSQRGPRKRAVASPPRELPFTGAIRRLSNWSGFSVGLVVASVHKTSNAEILYQACNTMCERCRLVQEHLLKTYPELAHHA